MPTTYDPLLPTDRDWVRFLIGDRGPTRFVLKDEEIDALLGEESNKYLAAARAGETILAQGKDLVSKTVDGLSLTWGSSSPESAYRKHLARLRQKGAERTMTSPKTFRVL